MKIKYFIDEFEGMFTGENWVAISLKDIIDKITPGLEKFSLKPSK